MKKIIIILVFGFMVHEINAAAPRDTPEPLVILRLQVVHSTQDNVAAEKIGFQFPKGTQIGTFPRGAERPRGLAASGKYYVLAAPADMSRLQKNAILQLKNDTLDLATNSSNLLKGIFD